MVTKVQLGKLGLFDAKVPRYTSYPTAPHFSSNVGPGEFATWVQAIEPGSQISLYVHVPFCRRLCWFCACRTQGTQTDKPVRAYLKTLTSELALLGKLLPPDVTLSRLHWGGGTPTLLTPQMTRDLAGAIHAVAPFAKAYEFSAEIDPNEIDGARLDALVNAGMNRVSIGVQDFDAIIQKSIGRLQSYEVTRDAITEIRLRGITSVNADILFGLPHQTGRRITDSVLKLLTLTPDRVALYGYAHVPWMAKRQQMIASESLPTPQERLGLFETARKLFLMDQYEEIGIDHFAAPGDSLAIAQKAGQLKRNFQGYTDDTAEALIGLGASAISKFPQGYVQNAAATNLYTAAIRDERFATTRGHVLNRDDQLRARLIEALMCDFAIDAEKTCDAFGIDPKKLHPILSKVGKAFPGILTVNRKGLFIPPMARPLTRMIARSLDTYELDKARHSHAI